LTNLWFGRRYIKNTHRRVDALLRRRARFTQRRGRPRGEGIRLCCCCCCKHNDLSFSFLLWRLQDQFLLFCCFVVLLLFFFFFAFYFSLSSSSLSSALFPFFSSSPTKQTDERRRVASLSHVIIVRKGNNLLASLNTRKTKKSKLLSPSLCACVIRLCKDLLRFELPLL